MWFHEFFKRQFLLHLLQKLSIFMGGENVGFLKIGMSPTLNLFAQNVSLVRVRVKTTKWLTWWTNFNGREQGKKMWMKLVKLHIQIPNFSCTDFSPSIIWSNPLLWFFLVALGWFYEAILLHRTLIFDAQKYKKENWIFFIGKNKDWNPNDDLIFFFQVASWK